MVKKSNLKKLSDTQIETIENLKRDVQNIHFELGRMYRQKWKLDEAIDKIKNETIPQYEEKEKEVLKAINEEFGDGHLNLETYEFEKEK